jgi:hypothetical protein
MLRRPLSIKKAYWRPYNTHSIYNKQILSKADPEYVVQYSI